MAKSRPVPDAPENSPKGSPAIILIAGAIIVIALVAFSFSRTLRTPQPPASAAGELAPSAAPAPQSIPSTPPTSAGAAALPSPVSPRDTAAVPIAPTIPSAVDAPPTIAQLASVPRINVAELQLKIEDKQVTVIDVRDADSYRARHIPGALHIPLQFIAGEVPYLPKDKLIVTYCT